MKDGFMKNIEMNEPASNPRRHLKWAAFGVIGVLAVLAAIWFGTRHKGGMKVTTPDTMSSMAGMSAPVNAASNASTGSGAELQVDLAPDDLKKAQIQTVAVGQAATSNTIRVPGIVQPNEYRVVRVTPLVGGVVRQVPVVLGDHVRRGQPLATIFSSELAEAETQYLAMLAELEADHKKLERTQTLVKLGSASQQEEEEVTASHAAHEAHVRSALEKLKLLGATDQQIASLRQAEQINPNFTVPAPINGVVLSRSANLGLVVNPAQELFTVADLSTVWVMASVNQRDFASVRVGSTATVTTPAYPGHNWKGRVSYIQPQVDATTRTAQARIEVKNPGETLRIEMYVDIEFFSQGSLGLILPENAVQSIGERQLVFVPVKNAEGSFALRQVRLGPSANGYYPVLEGLKSEDVVVTDGSFILKAEAIRQHPDLR
jgi:membrane fusion protein, heavy metal efflux system